MVSNVVFRRSAACEHQPNNQHQYRFHISVETANRFIFAVNHRASCVAKRLRLQLRSQAGKRSVIDENEDIS
jgi:hypothetical protein